MDSSVVIEHLRTENLVSGQSGLFSLAGMETMAENVFLCRQIHQDLKISMLEVFLEKKKMVQSIWSHVS